jgi:aldose 1-epimerase
LKHKHFPSPLFKAGQEYNHTTTYKFSVKQRIYIS